MKQFAIRYSAAWSSRDPAQVAAFHAENGSLTINGGEPAVGRAGITEAARSFVTAYPDMVIREIMDPHSQAEPRLLTTLLYTNLTAQAVYDALLQKGWSKATLPTVRTISNILARHDYRLRTVVKTEVQKKRRTPTQSSKTSGE